jgi:hypothetical protein
MFPFCVTSTKTYLACTEYMLGNTSRASHRQTNTKYWSVLPALLGENAIMHFPDSALISMGVLTRQREIWTAADSPTSNPVFRRLVSMDAVTQMLRWQCVVSVFRYIDSNYKHFAKNTPLKSYMLTKILFHQRQQKSKKKKKNWWEKFIKFSSVHYVASLYVS